MPFASIDEDCPVTVKFAACAVGVGKIKKIRVSDATKIEDSFRRTMGIVGKSAKDKFISSVPTPPEERTHPSGEPLKL